MEDVRRILKEFRHEALLMRYAHRTSKNLGLIIILSSGFDNHPNVVKLLGTLPKLPSLQ